MDLGLKWRKTILRVVAKGSKGLESLNIAHVDITTTLYCGLSLVTLKSKVRELQPNPFGKGEFRHKHHVGKTNHATSSKGMEGPILTKLATL